MIKILVVDDERDILTEVDEALTLEGYENFCVENVDDALDYLRRDADIALVVTDLKMPGKSGVDLIHQARSEFTRDIAFVVISGSPETFGLDIEEFPYLRKPVDIDKLLEAVSAAASRNAAPNNDELKK